MKTPRRPEPCGERALQTLSFCSTGSTETTCRLNLSSESVSPAALFLVSEEAPRRTILAAIAGGYSRIVIQETRGVYLREGERTPETIAARFGEIADLTGAIHSEQPGGPGFRFLQLAAAEAGVAPGIGT